MENVTNQEEFSFRPSPTIEDQQVAKVYAEALLNSAEEKQLVGDIKEELREFTENVFREEPQFEQFLASDAIGEEKKVQVLEKVFKDKTSELFFGFLIVLAKNNRLALLQPIYQAVIDLDNKRNRRIPVKVRSAVPLPEDQQERLLKQLREGFKLEPLLESLVEPDLLGGLIVQVGDYVFDASVKGELQKIRKQLLASSSHGIQSQRDRFFTPTGN